MSAPLFYVAGLATAGSVVVTGDEARHAVSVRRLRVGERVDLADGVGGLGHGVVSALGRDRLEVELDGYETVPEPAPRLVIVQALPKGDRAERAVELLTEVGVDEIVPWAAERCVSRWEDAGKAAKGRDKWEATARAAGKQCRRARLPVVAPLATTSDVVARLAAAAAGFVLHETATVPLAAHPVPAAGDVVLVVGPEGSLTPDEVAAFAAAGAPAVRLGPNVLRTSTAGVVAASVVLAASARWS